MSKEERKRMVSKDEKLSIRQQCVLLGLCRTSLYYTASEETAENLEIMRLLDRQYAITPFYGQRRLQAWLAEKGHLEIVNSDQGSQLTSADYVELLKDNGIAISMDSRGRALDDIFIERLWRSVKQEYVYLNPCETGDELWRGLDRYFRFYNNERLHQSLGYKTPASRYLLQKEAA